MQKEDKMTKQAREIQVGDIVAFRGRDPMPEAMVKAAAVHQKVTIADYPYFEFESGWSVNIEKGDFIYLVTPHPDIPNRATRRFSAKRRELRDRQVMRDIAEAKKKKDAKAMAKALAFRRAERRKMRKAGIPIYPKKSNQSK